MSVLIFFWWLSGYCISLWIIWEIDPKITVGDMIFSSIVGIVGPFNIIYLLIFSERFQLRKLLDKVIIKKDKS